jgi:hypothetical protein
VKYVVTVLPRAKRQLYESASWWAQHKSPAQASRWLDGSEQALVIVYAIRHVAQKDLTPDDI